MRSVVVGTAGHIDHGKTALVKALTGIDADRLEEEKRRGITIDIGFAHLELPQPGGDTLRLGFVDVPGHERFVRNMLAGIGGIDLVLLVIAADEGIKPQTREHFDICRMLAVERGITVLTKADTVDRDTLEVVRLEVEEFLRGSFLDAARAPIMAVSALTGAGLDALKQELVKVARDAPARDSAALARLPIDRVFTMKGFGTVVTGTLVSGAIRKEDDLEVFPAGNRVRVRGVQVHGEAADQAIAGQRTALNLAATPAGELARGMVLAPPSTLRSTSRADVSLSLLPSARPLKDRARVHLHVYTAETIAEVVLYGLKQVAPGQSAFAQLRLADPMLLLPGDRFIIRQFSPVITMGGGVVVENAPPRRIAQPEHHAASLKDLAEARPPRALTARIASSGMRGLTLDDAVARTGQRRDQVIDLAASDPQIVRLGSTLLQNTALQQIGDALIVALEHFQRQNPLVAGMSREELRARLEDPSPEVFDGVLNQLVKARRVEAAGEQVRLPGRGVVMKDEEAESKRTIEAAFSSAGLKVPLLKDVLGGLKVDRVRAQKIMTLLLRDRILVKLSDDLVFHRDALAELRKTVQAHKSKASRIDVAQFKDLIGVSRKYAIPLLEWLDRERVTRRVGDAREIV
jgi:selenocysteine-specific elongation factor